MTTVIDHLNNDSTSVTDIVFAVFGGKMDENNKFTPTEIYGTAFYIQNDTFITCAHTMKAASEQGMVALGNDENGEYKFYRVIEKEIYEENDSCIFTARIPAPGAKSFPWLMKELSMLHDVYSVGYPYGFNREENTISTRSYKGHIVLGDTFHRFPSKPKCYELSYMCPRGLSGSPLLFKYQDQSYVVGFVIGNEDTDMKIFSFVETFEDNVRTVHEKTESLHRGIALQPSSFENIQSKILNMPFLDYLRENMLLIE